MLPALPQGVWWLLCSSHGLSTISLQLGATAMVRRAAAPRLCCSLCGQGGCWAVPTTSYLLYQ